MKKALYIIISMILPILLLGNIAETISVVSTRSRQGLLVPDLIWEATSALEQPVNYSAAQAVRIGERQFIYLVGGETSFKSTRAVYVAEVFPDGSLSEWKPTASLPLSTAFGITSHKLTVVGEQLYVIGGKVNAQDTNDVFCAHPLPNGEIESWITITNHTLTKRINHDVVNVGNRIYVIGGWSSGVPTNTVYSGEALANCEPIQWAREEPLIRPLANAEAVSFLLNDEKGIIYVIGGWSNFPSDSIYFSMIDLLSDGSQVLGKWQTSTVTLDEPLYFHSAFAIQRQLFVIGGIAQINSANYTQTGKTYRILVDSNGGLNSLSELPSLKFDVFGHSSIVAGNQQAYIIGGSRVNFNDGQVQNESLVIYTPFAWITKSGSPTGEVFSGDEITYTIHYTNNGLRPLSGVIITDQVPVNSYLVDPNYPLDTRILTWTVSTLDLNESGSETFTVRIMPPLTAVPPQISTPSPSPTAPQPDSGLQCSTSWSGGGGTPRPTCTPTSTPVPLPTTPVPPTIPPPGSTRFYDLTPIPVINQAWLCEQEWCIQSNTVINTPYRSYLPIILRQ